MGKGIDKINAKIQAALANPELDKTKAALKDLKGRTTAELLKRKSAALDADLREIENLSQEQREGLKESFIRKAISESPEAANLSAFVDVWANYEGLNAVIAESKRKNSKKPLKKLVQLARDNAPLLATIGASLTAWLMAGKEEKKGKKKKKGGKVKPSKLDKAAAKADAVLGKGKGKKDKKTKATSNAGGTNVASGNAETPSGGYGSGAEAVPVNEKYKIRPKYSKKLSKEDFRKKYRSIKNRKERNTFVLQQVAAGNASNAFEKLKIKGKGGMTVTMEVDRTGLRVAGMDVQLDGPTAMTAAMLTGCTLPNKWVVDQTYAAARAKNGKVDFIGYGKIAKKLGKSRSEAFSKKKVDGEMIDVPNGKMMMSAEFALKRDQMLRAKRKQQGVGQDAFQAGHFKSILLPNVGKENKVAIYGARHAKSDKAIQPAGHPHGAAYSDYSHQVRRIKSHVTITDASGKKKKITTKEFYANKTYAKAFGFTAKKHGSYMTPELQAFADKKKGEKGKTPNLDAIAAADKAKNNKDKKDKKDKTKKS